MVRFGYQIGDVSDDEFVLKSVVDLIGERLARIDVICKLARPPRPKTKPGHSTASKKFEKSVGHEHPEICIRFVLGPVVS